MAAHSMLGSCKWTLSASVLAGLIRALGLCWDHGDCEDPATNWQRNQRGKQQNLPDTSSHPGCPLLCPPPPLTGR